MVKSLWKKLPLKIKAIIIGVGGIACLVFLLVFSFMGATDSGVQQMDKIATNSTTAFYLKWADGTEQEIYDFDNGEKSVQVDTFYIVAKKAVTLSGITFGTEKITDSVDVTIVAIGLPDEDGEVSKEETELAKYQLAYSSSQNIKLSVPTSIPQNLVVAIKFSRPIYLDFIAVNYEIMENQE